MHERAVPQEELRWGFSQPQGILLVEVGVGPLAVAVPVRRIRVEVRSSSISLVAQVTQHEKHIRDRMPSDCNCVNVSFNRP